MVTNIAIIIILFHPTKLNYRNLMCNSNLSIIIVDNTPNNNLNLSRENVYYIPLKKNVGIATAQNIGIEKAKSLGCTYIVFFDQDSIIEKNYVSNIVKEYQRISSRISNLFLLGPTVYNKRTGEEYKSKIHIDKHTDIGFIFRREIISSGSCLEISKIKNIGNLKDNLFIDYVDFEWCWRANYLGFVSGITPNIKLQHFVGQSEFKILGLLVIISSPIRYFYQYRNYLWLIRKKYVPFQWKFNTGIKFILRICYFPFCIKKWKQIECYMWKGLWHGLFKYKNL